MINYQEVESFVEFQLPIQYLTFVTTLNMQPFEIPNTSITLYPVNYLIERNTTYTVQDFEPESLLIGQDGDLGFFIRKNCGEKIFELGLGALGALEMRLKDESIYDFMEKIKLDYIDNE